MDSSIQKCPICYETIQDKNVIITNCNHTFCSNCILRLNRTSNSCPLCRAELTTFPIAENVNNTNQNIIHSNSFYRQLLEDSENAINTFETTTEGYIYIIQNLLSIIQILGIDEQIDNTEEVYEQTDNTEEIYEQNDNTNVYEQNDNTNVYEQNLEEDEQLLEEDYYDQILEDYDSNEDLDTHDEENIPYSSFITDSQFDLLYSKFQDNRCESLTNLATSQVWNYLDSDQKTDIYNKLIDDWHQAKIICLFPDIYNINNRLRIKLREMSINVLKIIIKHFEGNYIECYEKNDYINKILEILPNYIPSLEV